METIVGTVVETRGPVHAEPPIDLWRWGTGACIVIAVLPLWLVLSTLRIIFSVLLLALGQRRRRRSRHTLDGAVAFHLGRLLGRRPRPLHVYHHVVETERGRYDSVRQAGEFRDGRVFLGHRVRFSGRRRGGVLHVSDGWDYTVSCSLRPASSPWRRRFCGSLLLTALEYGVLLLAVLRPPDWVS